MATHPPQISSTLDAGPCLKGSQGASKGYAAKREPCVLSTLGFVGTRLALGGETADCGAFGPSAPVVLQTLGIGF